ncbi:hypothetical protein CYJ73_24140 [Gordonia terrae]|uniref:Secreted protein n=1 Tax=Gordonia terrae TaxID=2055 RepID=A0A2I1R1J8_9ACTN|nr:hypothetical protein [Gordonia terrae]PKZ62971.1 hypothetical protein CYJ73_24140 [Gordonia terrae]
MTMSPRERVRRTVTGVLIAGAVATGAGVATAGPAAAAVTPIGVVDGHRAFAVGPHGSAAQCAPTANRLTSFGAKKFGPRFGTCYRSDSGQWWAISPWSA